MTSIYDEKPNEVNLDLAIGVNLLLLIFVDLKHISVWYGLRKKIR